MRNVLFCVIFGLLLGQSSPAAAELNVMEVGPGVYVGSAPDALADFDHLQQLGIRTVIDSRPFRLPARRREERELVCRGIRYLHIPMDFHPADDRAPHHVLFHLTQSDHQPVYIHCQLGRDRTGLVVALYRVQCLGWPPAAAYAAMERQQFNPLLRDLDRYFWQNVTGAIGR